MNFATFIIGLIVAVLFVAALIIIIKKIKNKNFSCGGNCSSCLSCDSCIKSENKKE